MLKEIKKYYDNGALKHHYYINENKNFHGVLKSYYEDGSLGLEQINKNGEKYGIAKLFSYTKLCWIYTTKEALKYGIAMIFHY